MSRRSQTIDNDNHGNLSICNKDLINNITTTIGNLGEIKEIGTNKAN